MERPHDPTRIVVIVERRRAVVEIRFIVHVGPLASRHRDVGHGLPRSVFAVLMHVTPCSHRIRNRRTNDPIRTLILVLRRPKICSETGTIVTTRLTVRNQRDLAESSLNRRNRMRNVNHK